MKKKQSTDIFEKIWDRRTKKPSKYSFLLKNLLFISVAILILFSAYTAQQKEYEKEGLAVPCYDRYGSEMLNQVCFYEPKMILPYGMLGIIILAMLYVLSDGLFSLRGYY